MLPVFFQRNIIFRPVRLRQQHVFRFAAPFEERFYEMTDGTQLNALLFPSQHSAKPRRGLVLYFHGNADNLDRWGRMHRDFTERGYDFFCMDYRGYGKSSGKVNEKDFYADAFQMYQHLTHENYAPNEIIIYGRSLGSAVASHLAARVKAKMLVLETPFDNMKNLFKDQMRLLNIPLRMSYNFANDEHIQKVSYPILVLHGTRDLIVPYQTAERLCNYLKQSDEFVTIEGGRHKDLGKFDLFQEKLDQWLGERLLLSH